MTIIGISGRCCCVRAITGHAAALPSPAMNSRRRIGHASKPLCGQRISVRVAWERVVSRREANFLRAVASFAQSANGGPIATRLMGRSCALIITLN